MHDVIGKLSMESRRAFFDALMQAQSGGVPEITPELVASCLLNTPSVAELCTRVGVDDAALALALRSNPNSLERREAANPFESAGGSQGVLIAMPMSTRGKKAMEALGTQLEGEEFESVAPVRLLRELLVCDRELRDLCDRFGLAVAAFPSERR